MLGSADDIDRDTPLWHMHQASLFASDSPFSSVLRRVVKHNQLVFEAVAAGDALEASKLVGLDMDCSEQDVGAGVGAGAGVAAVQGGSALLERGVVSPCSIMPFDLESGKLVVLGDEHEHEMARTELR